MYAGVAEETQVVVAVQEAAAVQRNRRKSVQQTISNLLPQAKSSLILLDVKSKSRKRARDENMHQPVGLKSTARVTRSRRAVVV